MHAKTEPPLLSIVVVNYNYGRFLETAIKSIIEQDGFMKCELIIIDGGSTDNSVDVIKKYADNIAYWVSEKDNGQSDAFNKGFAKARGRLGCWVNADDILLPGTLQAVIDLIVCRLDIEWVTGGIVFFDNEMKIRKMRKGTWITKGMHRWVDATVIGGPSSFFSLKQLKRVGGFNLELHYTMDCDLWQKFFASGMTMHHIDRYFWGFRIHEASKTAHALTGAKTSSFQAEDDMQFDGRRFSKEQISRHVIMLRIFKVINGTLIRSLMDTKRYFGKNVFDVFMG
jgi:glycosyltransferase involved in cell wall biosynthesis